MSQQELNKDSIFIQSLKNPEEEKDMGSSEDESHSKNRKKSSLKAFKKSSVSPLLDAIGTLYDPDEYEEDDGLAGPLNDYKRIAVIMLVSLTVIMSMFVFAELHSTHVRIKNLERKVSMLEGEARFSDSPLPSRQCGDIQSVIDKLMEAINLASRFRSLGENDNPSINEEQPTKIIQGEGELVAEVEDVDFKEAASPSLDISSQCNSTTSPIQFDMSRTEAPIQGKEVEEQGKSKEKEDEIIKFPEPDLPQRSYDLTEEEETEQEEIELNMEEVVKSQKFRSAIVHTLLSSIGARYDAKIFMTLPDEETLRVQTSSETVQGADNKAKKKGVADSTWTRLVDSLLKYFSILYQWI